MPYYKNILIITDNACIAERFEKEVLSIVKYNDIEIRFCCSPFSNKKDFKNLNCDVRVADLRDKNTIESLILSKDLILSIHCKQIFPKLLVNSVKCINVHPGYNQINRGWYPQVFAIIKDLDIGATIHEIDEYLDHGAIIARAKVEKFEYDTSLSLYNRVVEKELELLMDNIDSIFNNTYDLFSPEEEGELNLKKDFSSMCELDLDEQLSMRDALKRLRGLSHGDYMNAYYIDNVGNKIYVVLKTIYETKG